MKNDHIWQEFMREFPALAHNYESSNYGCELKKTLYRWHDHLNKNDKKYVHLLSCDDMSASSSMMMLIECGDRTFFVNVPQNGKPLTMAMYPEERNLLLLALTKTIIHQDEEKDEVD